MILSCDDNVEKGDDDDNQRPQPSINVSGTERNKYRCKSGISNYSA